MCSSEDETENKTSDEKERERESLGTVGGRCPIDDRDSRGVAAGCISYQGNYGMMEVWNHKSNTLS